MSRVYGSIKRIIAVTSCKGGVGKSTVSMELARRLAAQGHSVGLFDADVHGPSLPTQIPSDVAAVGVSPAEDGWSMTPLEHEGMRLMSFGWVGRLMAEEERGDESHGDESNEIDPRGGGTAGELAVQLLQTTAWGDLDVLVVDTPPGTGEIPRALAARGALAGAVVVTTPSPLAIADVVRGVAMLSKFDVPILGVVENMSSFACGCGEVHRPFGTGQLDAVLDAVKRGGSGRVPAYSLPIVPAEASREPIAAELGALAEVVALIDTEPVAFPQLDWHEVPYWPDKIFFASRGSHRRAEADRAFKITPPRLDR